MTNKDAIITDPDTFYKYSLENIFDKDDFNSMLSIHFDFIFEKKLDFNNLLPLCMVDQTGQFISTVFYSDKINISDNTPKDEKLAKAIARFEEYNEYTIIKMAVISYDLIKYVQH